MIEKVLKSSNLAKALRKVEQNKGSFGVDKMEVSLLRKHVKCFKNEILISILKEDYKASPIRGVTIPKSQGGIRLLGVPTVVDRWLQQAVSQQLNNVFETGFSDNSFGFRAKKNLHKGVHKSLININDGYQEIVDIDLSKFFDEVAHYKLLQLIYNKVKCRITLRLIRKWLRAPILVNGVLIKRRKGIPQGSPLSPLLSNIMLDVLDKELDSRGLRFVRYADDFSIYCKTKSEAKRVGNDVYLFLRDKLCLPINKTKSGIRRPIDFTFLGFGFVPIYKKGAKGKYQLVVSKEGWLKLKRKLKYLTKKTLPLSFAERLSRLEEVWQGWVHHYKRANIYQKLKNLDEWLRNRIRYCIWHDWKKPERKRKNLIRLGIEYGQAYAWSRTRMGGWAVAQSPILRTTITVSRLKKRGYVSMGDYYKMLRLQL